MLSPRSLWLSAAAVLAALPVQAESLACSAGTVSEGDSRLALIYKCGPPMLADAHCSPVYQAGARHPVPVWLAAPHLPCLVTERLLYERGEGRLVAVVNLHAGVVRSISYGRQPR